MSYTVPNVPGTWAFKVDFPADPAERFTALWSAQRWLTDRGFVVGSSQHGAPTAAMPRADYCYVSKWRNLSAAEKAATKAIILFNADNSAIVYMREEPVNLAPGVRDALVDPGQWRNE